MRALLADVNCKSGSTGKIVYDIYSHLRENGHEAAICYGRGSIVNEPDIYKFSGNLEVYFHAFMTRLTGFTAYFSYFATKNLIRFIEQYKPDVVHLHDLHGYFLNIIPLMEYLKKKQIKTIWTFHCEFMYTGKCGYSYDCGKWKTQCVNCPEKRGYPESLFFDFTKKMFKGKKKAFKNFDKLTIVTPSKWLADRVRQSFLEDKEIIVVQNGIDTSIFTPCDVTDLKSKYRLTNEKIIVHVTGIFEDERKGGKYVLKLAERLPNIRFFIVGNREPILNLPDNVTAVGRTENQQELATYYSMADLSLITSKCENFPTVCIESLCCGTPVIGFIGGGTSETAPDNYGYFVKFGDTERLEQTIRDIFNDELKLESKKECAEFGKTQYSKATMARNYLKLYK